MGSIHHGMLGVFKGYNIKGVLFHQGYNNALFSNCRPKRAVEILGRIKALGKTEK